MEIMSYFAQDAQGNIMPSADCYLYAPGTTNLVSGLVSIDGSPLANPFQSSSVGKVQFGAPNGVYDLRIKKGARDTTIRIQCADLLQALNETASFLGARATAPTTRADGTPLQLADRYLNTTDQLEYLYKASGWVVNNVDGQLLATSSGASRVGAIMQDGATGTVQQAINAVDRSLRTDLGLGDVPLGKVSRVVTSMEELLTSSRRSDVAYVMRAWFPGSKIGGGTFYWDSTALKSSHNGGTSISPTVPLGSSLANFLNGIGDSDPGGTGCFVRAPGPIDPTVFGATALGVVSDADAVEKCIFTSSKMGISISDCGAHSYLVDRDVVIDRYGDGPVTMDWGGATMKFVNAQLYVGSETSSASRLALSTTLTSDPVRGGTKFSVSSVAGVAVGDLVVIESPALTSGTVNQICCYLVQDIIGNNIYVSGQLVVDQNAAQITASGQTGSITVKFYKLDKGLRFRNLTGYLTDAAGTKNAINFFFQNDGFVENVVIDGKGRGGVQVQYSGIFAVHKSNFKRYGYVAGDQGYSNVTGSPDGLSFGYGIALRRNFLTIVSQCTGADGWHLSDCARGQTYALFTGCVAAKNSFGFATHEGSWDVIWDGCHAFGGAGFDGTRCAYPTVKGCTVTGVNGPGGGHGITYRGGCMVVTIVDSIIDSGGAVLTSSSSIWRGANERPLAGVISAGQSQVLNVKGNTLRGKWGALLGFGVDGTTNIVGNTFEAGAYISGVALDKVTSLLKNGFSGASPAQHSITIRDGFFSDICSLTVDGNVDTATPMTTVNSAHVTMLTTLAHTVRINRCSSQNQDAILRVQNPITIKEMLNNFGKKGALTVSGAAAVIVNAVGNCTYTAFASSPITITNSVNNTVLV